MLDYVYMPKEAMSSLFGKPHTLSVFMCLAFNRKTKTNRSHFMSKKKISEICGVSYRQVYNSIDDLIAMGLIREHAEKRGEYMYEIVGLERVDDTQSEEDVLTQLQNMNREYEEI